MSERSCRQKDKHNLSTYNRRTRTRCILSKSIVAAKVRHHISSPVNYESTGNGQEVGVLIDDDDA